LTAGTPRPDAPRVGGPSAEHRRDTDAWHVVMGVAMSAMLLGGSHPSAGRCCPGRVRGRPRAGACSRSNDVAAALPAYGWWSAPAPWPRWCSPCSDRSTGPTRCEPSPFLLQGE